MGIQVFDQYTYLHFSSGIISYFWDIHLIDWIILHTIFEILENSKLGIKFINHYIKIWPGGKKNKDSFIKDREKWKSDLYKFNDGKNCERIVNHFKELQKIWKKQKLR